ncbi:protein B4 [Megalops cyprinoides]|uniref:protein B4 n=1 Tax=Megalops cyprinoides TaxID=118141 RepID=UPI001863DCF0|nr:protein B4 [Megalops cyprinoides]
MPPKKAPSVEVSSPQNPVSSPPPEAPKKGAKTEEKPRSDSEEPRKAPSVRKMSAHPSTMEMVKEALKDLDSRKGSSAQAIRGYILEKYPSVDAVRLKYMLRKALAKGLEGGALVRPANSTGNGAQGRFRLAARSKPKGTKEKGTENSDPNVENPRTKKTKVKEAGSQKSKSTGKKQKAEDSKPKASQEGPPSKVAPAKRPKKPAGNGGGKPIVGEAGSGAKARKTKAPVRQQSGEESGAAKNSGKRGKKTAE